MTIKGRLTTNIVVNFLLIVAIVTSALVGIGFVKDKIALLTERSTPFQTRTLDFQRTLQATVTDLMKASTSSSEQELSVAKNDAEKSLAEVKAAQEDLAKLSDTKTTAYDELATIAKDVIAASSDRLQAEKANQIAWKAAQTRIDETSKKLKELDTKIKGLQGSSSQKFGKSRESSGVMNRNLRNAEDVRRTFKDLQLVLQDIHIALDKKGVLLNKGKVSMSMNFLKQNEYVKEKGTLAADIKNLSGKVDELVKAKTASVGATTDDAKVKYDGLRKSVLEDMAAISLVIDQDAVALQERTKTESQEQGEVFSQFSVSNEVLSGTSALLTQASLLEGQANHLIDAMSQKEVAASIADLSRNFDGIIKNEALVAKSLQKLNAKKELAILGVARGNLISVRDSILGKDGIADKVARRLLVGQKSAEALTMLKGLVAKQAQAGRESILTAKEDQTKAIISVNKVVNFNRILLISIGAAGVILGLLMGVFLYRAIAAPLHDCIAVVDKIADGNLNVQISTTRKDELGILLTAVSRMSDNLKDIIRQVKNAAQSVASESGQLYSTAEQMATGAEEVASQAGTVATASEEMAATSSEIARNCLSAAEASNRAYQAAEAGAVVVEKTVKGMGRIAERVQKTATAVEGLGNRSEQIGDIVGTIKDIADQTNLLALNAAIEAARAGDQGRGFAVVADEVRALAERTTTATNEISAMISSIQGDTHEAVIAMNEGVHEVEQGSQDAASSGEVLREILEHVRAVSMQVNQIATAAEEQTATTGEISSNMLQITTVVQQTADGAQQSAGAARTLTGLSDELQKVVGRFQLNL
jgi:methyl-accepting chemotaxis protein